MNIDHYLLHALDEDIGSGDITTSSLIPVNHFSSAAIVAKENFILAGMPFVQRLFYLVDQHIKIKILKTEGSRVKSGQILAKIKGSTGSLLKAERTGLNVLQRLSGIASLTNEYVRRIKGSHARIVDTRKTSPGLRVFEKYAVRIGGGHNHRFGLYDGILIKDNHVAAVGSVEKAVRLAKKNAHHLSKVEVEVNNIAEAKNALRAGADVIMLDNMSVGNIRKTVEIIRSSKQNVLIEASGNITLDNVHDVALAGVDLISVGSLTHSFSASDISLNLD